MTREDRAGGRGRKFNTYFDHELGTVVVPEGVCPYPIGGDDGSVKMCVERGHCGCVNNPHPGDGQ